MKKLFSVSIVILLSSICAEAKIWRVNNNVGINADFTTLQAAHNGAASGDTLHIEGSLTSYASLTSNKKLTIIGAGFYLDQNPDNQAIPLSSLVNSITLNAGAEGTEIMGLDFNGNTVTIFCSDITIRRNRFCGANATTFDYYCGQVNCHYQSNNTSLAVNNIVITQNFGLEINCSRASTGVVITNNYIGFNGYAGDATTSGCMSLHTGAIALIKNNVFRRGTATCYNSSFFNNIMYAGNFAGTGNLVSNNLGSSTQFGNSDGNIENVVMSAVFLGAGVDISTDGAWKLKAGSPAIGAGFGSTAGALVDCGIFGGTYGYVLSGIPPVPSIYYYTNQPVGNNADPIDVSIKVKSNN